MPTKKVTPKTLSAAKKQVYENIGIVAHDAKQGHRNYSYTSHQAVTASVVPAMYEAGITARFKCEGLTVMDGFALFHCKGIFFHEESGGQESCSVYAGDKLRDGTTMGSVMSYAVKICYVKYFGLSTREKDLEEIQAESDLIITQGDKNLQKMVTKQDVVDKKHEASSVDIFNGTEMCSTEQQFEFMELCRAFKLTESQIDKRIEFEGLESIEEVSKKLMSEWIQAMDDKLEKADA